MNPGAAHHELHGAVKSTNYAEDKPATAGVELVSRLPSSE